jgi:DNA-binding MarR family transcriptional regulator
MNEKNLGLLLLDAFRWMDASLRTSLQSRGWPDVTPAQSLLMANLDGTGTRTAELARRMGVSRQAAHQTVRELEKLGLVEQREDPSNASAKLVQLKGRIGASTVRALRRALEAPWGDPLTLGETAGPSLS